MISLDPKDGVAQVDLDQLFAELQRVDCNADRQKLVFKALQCGVDQGHIREMLDHLECCRPEVPRIKTTNCSNSVKVEINHKWNWGSFFYTLICRYRSENR